MAWVKIDDHIDQHPKIARLSNDAFALFVCGLAYANRTLTDGFIPSRVGATQLRGDRSAVEELEAVGLWEPSEGGWQIHDYSDYQLSREHVLKEREDGKRRAAASYAKKQSHSSGEETAKKRRIFGDSSGDPESRVPSPVPESQNPKPVTSTALAERRAKNGAPPAQTGPVWEAYGIAYKRIHGADPLRNAKTNSQMVQFIDRVGLQDAVLMAAWFPTHRGYRYVNARHALGILLQDCEKLHTEWVTGNTLHDADSREVDRMSAEGGKWKRAGERLEAKKNETG